MTANVATFAGLQRIAHIPMGFPCRTLRTERLVMARKRVEGIPSTAHPPLFL